jgi:hypothetical protein
LEDQLVPLGNDVGDGATSLGLTEGNTTVHATSSLVLELIFIETRAQLSPILKTRVDRAVLLLAALVHLETPSLVKHKSTLLLGSVVTDRLLQILELSSLL